MVVVAQAHLHSLDSIAHSSWCFIMRRIRYLIVHCSATRLSQNYTVEQLYHDHVEHNGWVDIGYHYYITKDGTLWPCRPEMQVGAHCKGFNTTSIGICYEGGLAEDNRPSDTRTAEQLVTLDRLLRELRERYPESEIVGHRDMLRYRTKACPCFDARKYYAYLNKTE